VFKYFSDECGWHADVSKCSSFGGGLFIFVSFLSGFVSVLEFCMVVTGRRCMDDDFPDYGLPYIIGMCVVYYIGV
jgi:hypothetical protein